MSALFTGKTMQENRINISETANTVYLIVSIFNDLMYPQ